MDGVVVKTKDPSTLIVDLKQTFDSLHEYKWKLNPTKCVFGVPSGQLLGFLVSHRGIEASMKYEIDSSNHSDDSTSLHQRCSETDRVHGYPQSFHLVTRGKRFTFLQVVEKVGQVQVDS